MQQQVPASRRRHVVDAEILIPVDALASALLGMLMAALAVVLGHNGDVGGLVLAGGALFGGLGLVHWSRRVRSRRDR